MIKHILHIALFWVLSLPFAFSATKALEYSFDFYEGSFSFYADQSIDIPFKDTLSSNTIQDFYLKMNRGNYEELVNSLKEYKKQHKLNDWLYYQLVRKTAQNLSPKVENYSRYTLYKWFLMCKSGYDARLAIGNNQIIFFIRNNEDISDIPFVEIENNKYTCLNYHDYGKLFKHENAYKPVAIKIPEAKDDFSYKITKMPDFKPENYIEKKIGFKYKHKQYHFKVKLNPEVSTIFANYPVVDFATYFNIPLSKGTYESLVPTLKKNLKGKNAEQGVDYLMRFTRYAFLYENDGEIFGKEKRLSPEETLINEYSDCDDRAALFFFLVKEIYNLPMIAVLYPTHITMAVAFDKPIGNSIMYNGNYYSICEPTPQKQNLAIGQLSDNLKNQPYQIVYNYLPH